jgi:hypothetical protein
MLGSLLGPLASKIGSFFSGLFDRNKGRDLVEQFAQSMGGFDALHAKLNTLGAAGEQLWIRLTQGVGRNNPEQAKAAIEAIQAAFAGQEDMTARAEAAIQKYGFSFEELGSKIQQSRLTEMGKELLLDFQALTEIGVDANAIIERMSGSVSDFVQKAMATGLEVPAAMRPMIEKMVEAGTLLDANGQAFTDLSQIPFAETMTQGFDRVVNKIGELIDRLTNGVGGALDNLGRREVRIPIGFDMDAIPTPEGRAPQFQGGTPGLGFVDFGRGRPALLHGREAVIPSSRTGDFAAQVAGHLGGGVGGGMVEVHSHVYLDGEQVQVAVERAQVKDLMRRGRLNR